MKLKITQPGCFAVIEGKEQELDVGSFITVPGDKIPKALQNKCTVVDEAKTDAEDLGLDREALKAEADELGIDYARNIKTEKLKELVDTAKEAAAQNAE